MTHGTSQTELYIVKGSKKCPTNQEHSRLSKCIQEKKVMSATATATPLGEFGGICFCIALYFCSLVSCT